MNTQLKVLCVDDNKDTANSTALMLQQEGFEALACHSGEEALSLADTFHPDVYLIDLTMPGMAGDQLVEQLRERVGEPHPRFIAVTGSWDITSQHRTHNAGFEEHLVKPVEPARLIAAIRGAKAVANAQGA